MKAQLAALVVIVVLISGLIWQSQSAGELREQVDGYVTAIESMIDYENKQKAQRIADDNLLAESAKKTQTIIRENYELRKQLQQVDGCSNDYIDADTVKWVRQYRSAD